MMAALQETYDEDFLRKYDEDYKKGQREENINCARKMKLKGFSIEDIQDITGLSKEEIDGL